MRIIRVVLLAGLLTAPTLLVTAAPAGAAPAVCTSEHLGETFPGGIVVPTGATCRLLGSEVHGNVVVGPGATFFTFLATVTGSVTATDAGVSLFLSRVGGTVLVRGQPGALSGRVCSSTIGGSVVVRNARPDELSSFTLGGPGLGCRGNTIAGSVILENNGVHLVVARNRISGGLLYRQHRPRAGGQRCRRGLAGSVPTWLTRWTTADPERITRRAPPAPHR